MNIVDKMSHGPEFTGTINEPWFTRGSITFLEKILKKNMVVMEYGCGTSTVWYANRVKLLLSIEHDKSWFNLVNKYIKFKSINNVNLKYFGIYNGYIEFIDSMGEFDLISVDGRRRSDSIKHAYTHVKIGGYLLLDNAERERYQQAIKDYLSNWKRIDFYNKIWLTSIFQKI